MARQGIQLVFQKINMGNILLKKLQLSLPTVRTKIKKHLMPVCLSDYIDELTQEVMHILRGVPQDLFLFDDNSPPPLAVHMNIQKSLKQ